MSDRIDELVAICTEQMNACNGCPNLLAIHEIAAIARKAEAMCEWLASHDIVEKYEGGRRTYEFPEFTERGSQLRFKAAREAVK